MVLVNDVAILAEALEQIDRLIDRDRVSDALDLEMAARLAMDCVFDVYVGLVGDQDAARRRSAFQPRGQIYATADGTWSRCRARCPPYPSWRLCSS
jgi:hypothetical protein